MIPYLLVGILSAISAIILLWPMRFQRRIFAAFNGIFCLLSLAMYSQFGNPAILPLMDQYHQEQAEAREVIMRESEAVKTEPKNLEAWVRLGQAFAKSHQWKPAANAFKQSVLLTGGQPDLIMSYARATIMGEGGKISDQSKKSLEMVLLQKPEHAEARYYMNVRLLQDGKTEEAMKGMKELYKSLPDNSPVKAMIDSQIGRR